MNRLAALGVAQGRVLAGTAAAYRVPFVARAIEAAVGAPCVEEIEVAGVPATIARPGRGSGPWPAVVVLPGVTALGRRHPAFQGMARAIATTGSLAVVPEPDGLVTAELTPAGREQVVTASLAVTARRDAGPRIALVGVSGGATLALLAATDPRLASRVSIVAALAPCCDLPEAIRVTTTGYVREGGQLEAFQSGDLFKLGVARTVIGCLPAHGDRERLRGRLAALDLYAPEPLAALRVTTGKALGDEARTVLALLANEDEVRFDDLYAALSESVRSSIEGLSATAHASRIEAPVELVAAANDRYIPLADARRFVAACPKARLTVTETTGHVPRLSFDEARDLARLDGVLVRTLAAARS